MKNDGYHHGDLKNALIEAALSIIVEEGIDALSIRYAARRIGVSHAAPYRHFRNKEELTVAIAVAGFRLLEGMTDEALSDCPGDGGAQLAALVRAEIDFAVAHPDYYRVMFRDYILNKTDYPDLFAAYDALFRRLVGLVEASRVERAGPPESRVPSERKRASAKADAELTALAISSLIHGYASLIIDNARDPVVGSKRQIDAVLRKMMHIVGR